MSEETSTKTEAKSSYQRVRNTDGWGVWDAGDPAKANWNANNGISENIKGLSEVRVGSIDAGFVLDFVLSPGGMRPMFRPHQEVYFRPNGESDIEKFRVTYITWSPWVGDANSYSFHLERLK
jgi:hypothetical protein